MLEAAQILEAKDALSLLEVPSMLDFSGFPMQIFKIAW